LLSSVADRRNWHIESVPEGTGVPVACQFSPNDVAGSCGWCRPSATCAGLGTVGCAVVGGLSAVFRQGNKYAYAGDDPINNTDPTGQGACASAVIGTATSIFGFLGGTALLFTSPLDFGPSSVGTIAVYDAAALGLAPSISGLSAC